MNIIDTDILVIGSGPSGYSASIYAARGGMNCTLVAGMLQGGQLTTTTLVENYPGFAKGIMGPDLMQAMLEQVKNLGVSVKQNTITKIEKDGAHFIAHLSSSIENAKCYRAKSIIVATGASAKWLDLPKEQSLIGKGITSCATCDGFFFKDKKIVVVGGGNTAAEEALYMLNHTKDITVIHRRDKLRADSAMQQRLMANKNIKFLWDSQICEIMSTRVSKIQEKLSGIKILNNKTKEVHEINIDGLFVAIGHNPNTSFIKNLLTTDESGYIVTKPGTPCTSMKGIFAAGDVADKVYRQAITAAGTGAMAAIEAINYINS